MKDSVARMFYTAFSTWLFLLLVQLLTTPTGGNGSSTPVPHQTFSLDRNPPKGVQRLNSGWTVESRIVCASKCQQTFPYCRSFMFNANTGFCTPGCLFDSGSSLPTAAEGNLYHTFHFQCDASKGFAIRQSGSVKACVGKFATLMTYFDARASCEDKGGYLMSVRTSAKLNILKLIWQNEKMWVGGDDLKVEGTFVWLDNGESFTVSTKPVTLGNGEPNDYLNDEDCLGIDTWNSAINDLNCSHTMKYACEIPMR